MDRIDKHRNNSDLNACRENSKPHILSYLSKELTYFPKGQLGWPKGSGGSVSPTPPPPSGTASPAIAAGCAPYARLLPASLALPPSATHFRAPATHEPYPRCRLCSGLPQREGARSASACPALSVLQRRRSRCLGARAAAQSAAARVRARPCGHFRPPEQSQPNPQRPERTSSPVTLGARR